MRKFMVVIIAVLALFTFLRDRGVATDTFPETSKAQMESLILP